MQHDFPGNVRELENLIESAVLLETTDLLQSRSLPLQMLQGTSQTDRPGWADAAIIRPLDEVERNTILHALEISDNNISAAAQALGIDRSTLHRKLKKYSLLP